MNSMPPQVVLAFVQVRRNLRGTIKAGEQALLAIKGILETIRPKSESCLFEGGIAGECRCQKET